MIVGIPRRFIQKDALHLKGWICLSPFGVVGDVCSRSVDRPATIVNRHIAYRSDIWVGVKLCDFPRVVCVRKGTASWPARRIDDNSEDQGRMGFDAAMVRKVSAVRCAEANGET